MSNDANPSTAPLPSSTSEVRRNAYLQGRLYLGMLNVGSWVVFATLLLASGVLESLGIWLAKPGLPDFAALSMMVLGFCLMQLPFDWLGGHWLPRRYGLPSHFTLPSYCMAVFKHSLIFFNIHQHPSCCRPAFGPDWSAGSPSRAHDDWSSVAASTRALAGMPEEQNA